MLLKTNRLLMRELEESDWKVVHAYCSDPEFRRYKAGESPTEEESRASLQEILARRDEQPRKEYHLAIILPAESRLIGSCMLLTKGSTPWEAELGYALDRRYWGHGYATEAAYAILRIGFRELGLHRIVAKCRPENAASVRVLEKIGMRLEGHLRENLWFNGRWWDTLVYALLDHEWQQGGR